MTEQILVPFEGQDSGVGELTWGQWDIWPAMQHEGSSLGIGGAFPLPDGTTVRDVAAGLGFLMSRYAALRTRLSFAGDGRPRQVLAKSGEIALDVVDAGGADPAEVAAALYRRYDEYVFDYVREWPLRWGAVGSGGSATHQAFLISHIATDGEGVLRMLDDLASRDPVNGHANGLVTGMPPLELARLQAAPAAQRRSGAALRHWERLLRAIPAVRFAGSADRREPRYWQAWYNSPASHVATQAIAARTGVSTSTVLLAAFAVTLTRITGINPAVVQVVVNNRFRRELADVVSPLCHSSPCVIDVADVTFDEVVARAWRAAVGAYKFAYYDPFGRDDLIKRVCRERGEQIDLSCFVNDRRMRSQQEPGGQLPTSAQVRAALPQSALTWGYERDRPSERCFLHIDNVPDTVHYELRADTHYLAPADMEACLRGQETMLVEAALDPAARTGVRARDGGDVA